MLSSRIFVATLAVVVASVASAAESNAISESPLTGARHPHLALAEQTTAAASAIPSADAVTRSGYVDIDVSGVIKSNVPPAASRQLICFITFRTMSYYFSRSAYIPAVIAGNKYTCTGKIYYNLTVSSTERLGGNGIIYGLDKSAADVFAPEGYGSGGVTFTFPYTASFPANGAVTKLTATEVHF